MLVALYLVFQIAVAVLKPNACPPIPSQANAPKGSNASHLAGALAPPLLLIVVVLGSILGGLATPTEAAAIGAFGAVLLTARKIDGNRTWPIVLATVAIIAALLWRALVDPRFGRTTPGMLGQVGSFVAFALIAALAIGTFAAIVTVRRAGLLQRALSSATQMTSMIFTILIGATLFSLVFRGLRGDELVERALADLSGNGAVLAVMVAMFLLGFVMDAFEIIFVVVPIVAPALLKMPAVHPVWLGVMMAMNLQTSYMHPPLGPTLFYLRGAAPPEITTLQIYVGIIPFVVIQIAALGLLWTVPELATWLPHALYGG
jgi:TRAP-type mannitol/chloroaromatic compound transport system permease large subunit